MKTKHYIEILDAKVEYCKRHGCLFPIRTITVVIDGVGTHDMSFSELIEHTDIEGMNDDIVRKVYKYVRKHEFDILNSWRKSRGQKILYGYILF